MDFEGLSDEEIRLREEMEYATERFVNENFELFVELKRKRRVRPRPDYYDSVWGQMLLHPEIDDPHSYVGKKFRRRFRVPYFLFKNVIWKRCREEGILKTKIQARIPLEFKILIALRILGRDAVGDDCEELSFVGESTCTEIFKQFVKEFTEKFYADYVRFPTGDELLQVMEMYRRLGFPGCIGSIDVTHVHWAMCYLDKKWKATGKEGYPTLAFEAIVTHSRYVYHCSIAFYGSYNDITISRNDEFILAVLAGAVSQLKYVLYDENGVPKLCNGAYFLSDNGYSKWGIFICPWKTPTCRNEMLWSEWAESTRKDVECFYSLVKGRFWFFRNGIRYHSAQVIQDAFRTACILHNMLLEYDGLRTECGDSTAEYWENLHPDFTDTEIEMDIEVASEMPQPFDLPANRESIIDMFHIEEHAKDLLVGRAFEPNRDFTILRNSLVTHFTYQYSIGDIWWPKSMSQSKRNRLQIPVFDARMEEQSKRVLYHRPSLLVARDSNGQTYTSSMGHGLFSHITYNNGDVIAVYEGDEWLTNEQRIERDRLGEGGYILQLAENVNLDCYRAYRNGKCLASYCNSKYNTRYKNDPTKLVRGNCEIKVDTRSKKIRIKCCVPRIQPHEEIILTSYGRGYVYPPPEH